MTISEMVANAIMEMLDKADGIAEIQRNELAAVLGCVPSQINYVITSRFTPEQGYAVESRRGTSGCIRIKRINLRGGSAIMHVINSIGQTLDYALSRAVLSDLAARGLISEGAARLILSAMSETALRECPAESREKLRAALFKQMLINAS